MTKEQIEHLTRLQKDVIILLNQGWELITDSEVKGAQVCCSSNNGFHIDNGVFFRLVNKGFIYQQSEWPFNYVLTPKAIKWFNTQNPTKPAD